MKLTTTFIALSATFANARSLRGLEEVPTPAAAELAPTTDVTSLPPGNYKGSGSKCVGVTVFRQCAGITVKVDTDANVHANSTVDVKVKSTGSINVDLNCPNEPFTLNADDTLTLKNYPRTANSDPDNTCITDQLPQLATLESITYEPDQKTIVLKVGPVGLIVNAELQNAAGGTSRRLATEPTSTDSMVGGPGSTGDATDDGYSASPTDTTMGEYKQKLAAFMGSHKAEIEAFTSKHKAAIGEAQDDIAKAIKSGDFNFENYQQQLKDIVDKHDLAAYKQQFEAYMESHKAEIKQFVDENKGILQDVEDKINEAVASGQFDFTHYKEQLQAFVNQYDLQKYQKDMDQFIETHKDQIESFVAANKQAVEDVSGDISDLIKTGSFDFSNFEQTIQDLVTRYDQGLSKYSPSPEQEQEIKGAIDTAKNSQAGKTLAGYVQQIQQQAGDIEQDQDQVA